MAVVLESAPAPAATTYAADTATALALDSLGLGAPGFEGYTPLPARVVQGIVALSGLITGLVWLLRLQGRG
jgi:hypothetical protein